MAELNRLCTGIHQRAEIKRLGELHDNRLNIESELLEFGNHVQTEWDDELMEVSCWIN